MNDCPAEAIPTTTFLRAHTAICFVCRHPINTNRSVFKITRCDFTFNIHNNIFIKIISAYTLHISEQVFAQYELDLVFPFRQRRVDIIAQPRIIVAVKFS